MIDPSWAEFWRGVMKNMDGLATIIATETRLTVDEARVLLEKHVDDIIRENAPKKAGDADGD